MQVSFFEPCSICVPLITVPVFAELLQSHPMVIFLPLLFLILPLNSQHITECMVNIYFSRHKCYWFTYIRGFKYKSDFSTLALSSVSARFRSVISVTRFIDNCSSPKVITSAEVRMLFFSPCFVEILLSSCLNFPLPITLHEFYFWFHCQ